MIAVGTGARPRGDAHRLRLSCIAIVRQTLHTSARAHFVVVLLLKLLFKLLQFQFFFVPGGGGGAQGPKAASSLSHACARNCYSLEQYAGGHDYIDLQSSGHDDLCCSSCWRWQAVPGALVCRRTHCFCAAAGMHDATSSCFAPAGIRKYLCIFQSSMLRDLPMPQQPRRCLCPGSYRITLGSQSKSLTSRRPCKVLGVCLRFPAFCYLFSGRSQASVRIF